jgi:hypothetical protein
MMSRASEVVMLETWLADSRREQTRRIRRHKMHARDIRGIVIDHLGLSALTLAIAVSALTLAITLAVVGTFPGQGESSAATGAAESAADTQGVRPAVVTDTIVPQARTTSQAALPELQIFEEPALHGFVAPRAITQAERDLWLLEEPNMHHLVPREGRSLDWIWTDPLIFDEPNLHHLVPPHATR